ncbi:MAG: hypothetical protein FJZ79_06475 [Chlorobi bacterium]|nr:hypothetical protein [Chlorobiota bacterium]
MLSLLFLAVAGGCASDRPPSGGPSDKSPLRITTSQTRLSPGSLPSCTVSILFSHPVSGRELLKALMFTPAIGNYDVSASGNASEIRIYETLKPGTTYRIILNKYMLDIRGRRLDNPVAIAFSTDGVPDTGTIAGKVYNYGLTPATEALLLAFSEGSRKTDPDYLAQTGPDGTFRFDNIAEGRYRVFAIADLNRDMHFNPETEPWAIPDKPSVASGTASLLLRFAQGKRSETGLEPAATDKTNEQPGTLSGRCQADAKALTVEALRHGDNTSFLTAATLAAKGIFRYTFPALPPGTYTVSASIPAEPGKNSPPKPWRSGRLEPFTPSEPFGVFADTVKIRPGWVTDAIDFSVRP